MKNREKVGMPEYPAGKMSDSWLLSLDASSLLKTFKNMDLLPKNALKDYLVGRKAWGQSRDIDEHNYNFLTFTIGLCF